MGEKWRSVKGHRAASFLVKLKHSLVRTLCLPEHIAIIFVYRFRQVIDFPSLQASRPVTLLSQSASCSIIVFRFFNYFGLGQVGVQERCCIESALAIVERDDHAAIQPLRSDDTMR